MSHTVLLPNQQLNVNDQLNLPNGAELIMQGDGNLVLYPPNGPALWASNTWGTPANHAIMQTDGNFVIYDANGKAYWSTGTWGNPGACLVLQLTGKPCRLQFEQHRSVAIELRTTLWLSERTGSG